MTESHRLRQLQHIAEAIAAADRMATPEQLAEAAHALQCALSEARGAIQPQLPLRAAQ